MAIRKITDQALENVRTFAEAATASPWTVDKGAEADGVRSSTGSISWDDHGGEVFTPEDAAFIAATDPQFILDLIADRNYWKQEAAYNLRLAEEQNSQAQQG